MLKVIVLPFTCRVEPSVIRLPSVVELVVRAAETVGRPAPTEAVRPNALRKSALPVTLRSAPVEVRSVITPAVMLDKVWDVLAVIVPALL